MKEQIHEAVEALKSGGTLLYPTDTIWGIGCDATNAEACQKIIDLKGRTAEKSFILLMDSFRMVERYIPDFPEVVYDLVDLATRPMTIIYPNAKDLPGCVLAEDGSVGIRIPQDDTCKKLISKLRAPLVSTSANLSGNPVGRNLKEIDEAIHSGVDHILKIRTDENLSTPSQIIKIDLDGSVKVIRK